MPEVKDKFSAQGFTASWTTPEKFSAFLKEEVDKWAKTVKASGASLN